MFFNTFLLKSQTKSQRVEKKNSKKTPRVLLQENPIKLPCQLLRQSIFLKVMNLLKYPRERNFLLSIVLLVLAIGIVWRVYSVSFTDSLFFFIAVFLMFFIPGIILLQGFRENFTFPEFFLLCTVTGIVCSGVSNLFAMLIYYWITSDTASIVGPFSYAWSSAFGIIFAVQMIRRKISLPAFRAPKGWGWLAAVLFVIFFIGNAKYHNGYVLPDGTMGLDSFHEIEPLVHTLFSMELVREFPMQAPFAYGVKLGGYHFMSDLLLAQIHSITGIAVRDLFFRMAFTLVYLLILGTAWSAINRMVKNSGVALLWALLVIVGGSLSPHVIPLILLIGQAQPELLTFSGHLFLAIEANLQTGLWISIFFTSLMLFQKSEGSKIKSQVLLGGFLVGCSIHFLAFGGAVAITALGLTGVWFGLKDKKGDFFKSAFIAGIVALPILLQLKTSSPGQTIFKLSGGWHLITTAVRLGLAESAESIIDAAQRANLLIVLAAWIFLFLLSVAGMAGYRLWGIKIFLWDISHLSNTSPVRFWLAINILLGFICGTFISLGYSYTFDTPSTIYFIWLNGFIPLGIYGAIQYSKTATGSTKRRRSKMLALLLFLALPNCLLISGNQLGIKFMDFEELYESKISAVEAKALQKVRDIGGDDWMVVPEKCYYPALAGHRLFIVKPPEGLHNFFVSDNNFDELTLIPKTLFSTNDPETAAQIFKTFPDIQYIFACKGSGLHFLPVKWLKEVYVEQGVGLYSVVRDKLSIEGAPDVDFSGN